MRIRHPFTSHRLWPGTKSPLPACGLADTGRSRVKHFALASDQPVIGKAQLVVDGFYVSGRRNLSFFPSLHVACETPAKRENASLLGLNPFLAPQTAKFL